MDRGASDVGLGEHVSARPSTDGAGHVQGARGGGGFVGHDLRWVSVLCELTLFDNGAVSLESPMERGDGSGTKFVHLASAAYGQLSAPL